MSRTVRRAGASAALVLTGAAFLVGAAPQERASAESPARSDVAGILEALASTAPERSGAFADRGTLLQAGFDAFIERMDAFDGEASVALARSLYREDAAIWSAFCLEGALRRSAGSDPASDSDAAFLEAESMLKALRTSQAAAPAASLAITHRLAILYAGFGLRERERAALGAALASGGIDGSQITALAALAADDHATAARLFGALLDRMEPRKNSASAEDRADDSSVTSASTIERGEASYRPPLALRPEEAPWALRGHALATLELLRNDSSIPD